MKRKRERKEVSKHSMMEIQSELARTVRNDRHMQQLLKGGKWGDCPEEDTQDKEEKEVFFAPNPNRIRTVMARNLPRNIMSFDLHDGFSICGTVQDIYLPKNMDKNSPYYGTFRGFALIKYESPLEAARAVAMGPLQIGKNVITLEFAKADHPPLKTGDYTPLKTGDHASKGQYTLSEGQKDH